jgi:lipopolysaccharide/colanic/teichoic acid biosynthesis glycosyltransferase
LTNRTGAAEAMLDLGVAPRKTIQPVEPTLPPIVDHVESHRWQARRTSAAAVKRAIDIVVGTVLTIAALPLMALLAVIAAVHFRAWPFFTQTRLGRDGSEFTIVKIRSLPPVTDPYALKPALGELELSWFSSFLRRSKLDELPQLFLVPTGHMTLVGPRPKMPDRFEPVGERYSHTRTRVRQGCSCIWQVGVATHGLPSEAPEFDYFYLLHGGLRLDAWIVWRTALTLVGASKPIELDEIPQWVRGKGWIERAEPHLHAV